MRILFYFDFPIFQRKGADYYIAIAWGFEPRAIWVGLNWKVSKSYLDTFYYCWICILPLLPIEVSVHVAKP